MSWIVHHGDCLEILKTLPAGSVDAVPLFAERRTVEIQGELL